MFGRGAEGRGWVADGMEKREEEVGEGWSMGDWEEVERTERRGCWV